MKPLRAVIFDVDGTLVDSNDIHARAWQDALRDFGHQIRLDDIRRQIGKGGDQLIPVFLDEKERAKNGAALEAHRGGILKQRYLEKVRPFPEVRSLFEAIAGRGLKIELASSAKKDELGFYKRVAHIEDLVAEETSSSDAKKSKPYPDIFEAALGRLQLDGPHGVVVIGDTPYDAEAARKSGLDCIGVTCGGWSADELRNAGCSAVYADPADLLQSLDEWSGTA